jgi:type I restriction enzyme S subunit
LTSPEGDLKTEYQLKTGDILFARTGASVGKSYYYSESDGKLFFAGFLIKFSVVSGNAYFIYLQTLTYTYRKWVQRMSMRSGQPGINAEEFKSLKVCFPKKDEQDKIAHFLSTLDEKIGIVDGQLEKTKTFKIGLLQGMLV